MDIIPAHIDLVGAEIEMINLPNREKMMKMALGENPKRCYGSEKKMPMTRMGTGAVLRKALFDAKQYSDAVGPWREYLPILDR